MKRPWVVALIGLAFVVALGWTGCTVLPIVQKRPPVPQVANGKRIYDLSCTACHQENGEGLEGVSLTLVDSKWVLGPESRLVRIVLHGVRGPIVAGTQEANLEMPAMGFFSDEEIAAVLTYIRNAWGNRAAPVSADAVRRIREETRGRGDSWTVAELENIR